MYFQASRVINEKIKSLKVHMNRFNTIYEPKLNVKKDVLDRFKAGLNRFKSIYMNRSKYSNEPVQTIYEPELNVK